MGVKALKIGDLEREVAVKIRDAVDAAGWTPAQLAREASITKARVYTLLDSESPMTITTFAAMCRALGLTASEVVREAEEAVARAGDAVVDPDRPRPSSPGASRTDRPLQCHSDLLGLGPVRCGSFLEATYLARADGSVCR